ncbi:MAG TPA: MgtC/SapB family protein [Flavobacterium sp.]|nr:MgtC/SapB family protein [Flavobacterium sp.]
MEIDVFYNQWETMDTLKAIGALTAGVILGFERELKDKAAGLRTITLICMGSALFTILSYKMGMGTTEDATRIASYVVSGVGFLGAGVIFKDTFSISGLTTASIIWVAAAIGMSIGFGQFSIAFNFLVCSLIIIHFGGFVNRKFLSTIVLKNIEIKIDKTDYDAKASIENELKSYCKRQELVRFENSGNHIYLFYECKVYNSKLKQLEMYLLKHEVIQSFSL